MKFDIDVNGILILNVEAKELSEDGNGYIVNLIIKNDEVSYTDEEMKKLKEKMKNIKENSEIINNIENDINIKGLLKKYKTAYENCINKEKKNKDEEEEEERRR